MINCIRHILVSGFLVSTLLCNCGTLVSQEKGTSPSPNPTPRSASLSASLSAWNVEFVVGDLLATELKSGSAASDPNSSVLRSPFGVDFDSHDNMYIVELGGGRIHRRTPSGVLSQIGGDGSKSYRGDGGPLANATFNGMHNCAITPNNDLYIADSWNHCIRKVDASTGITSTFAGTGNPGFSGDGGPAHEASFNFIMCITLNPAGDQLFVADLKNRRIRVIDLATKIVRTVAGNGQTGVPKNGAVAIESPLVDPRAVTCDSKGNVYVLERNGQALRVVDTEGKIHTVAGTGKRGHADGPAMQATFGSPKHICVDNHDNIFIADDQNKAIRKYDPRTKTVRTVLGKNHGDQNGNQRIQLSHPHGVTWHNAHLYVIDTGHNRIMKLTPN